MEKFLFWLCWIAYFSTYIGRLNYSASLTGIILSEGFSKGQAGMIGTAFFFAYGAGQFVSGFLGDRLAPKKMVFTGLMVSGLCNLAMAGAKSSGLMTAVNTMLIAVLPSYFGVIGRASSVSGLLNSSVYAGGAVSTYGIGALSVALGWNATIVIWFLMAAVSAVICFLTVRKWIAYRKEVLQIWKE